MGTYVTGLREITRGMERAGVDVEDLKDVMGEVATEAAHVMKPFIPRKSGALADTARPNRAKGRAIVTVGRGRTSLRAAPVIYGWPKRHIRSSRAVERTDDVMETKAPQILEQGWAAIAERHGLA
ncbi:hypothetical protein GCM10009798_43400 [Nocardioides panacihumi]|uniref:HK97 gp10 family phage protein n=1 Tax=Nocardioides panacihumi TaxID=400774 RepID=A0ABP5DBV5_9ACTN